MRRVVALLVVACAACSQAPVPAAAGNPADGAALFQGRARAEIHCGACHGEDARGGAQAPDLRARAGVRSDAEWMSVILDGEDAMPAYRGKLDHREVAAVLAFLRGGAVP